MTYEVNKMTDAELVEEYDILAGNLDACQEETGDWLEFLADDGELYWDVLNELEQRGLAVLHNDGYGVKDWIND